MINEVQITEVTSIDEALMEELMELLIDVVDEGASVGFLPPLSREEARKHWESVLKPDAILWIARLNHKVCGAIQMHLTLKTNGVHRAEVAKLMVHSHQRRKGIGRALMTALESRAKVEEKSLLVLDTRSGDPSNILYKSLGYVEVGIIPDYAKSADGNLEETVLYYKKL
ncbi:Ribosomal protein S18 acetylase RimI [Marininema mesophilum]|uniref:Ribosomal protein S18 acetylase RimI n=1 Tax=Marininema mesophilum TaxID=1048340 RepID=A0A1H3AQJ6_9BACL|nr:Ribosomal protein S18 acetylase RimI [Marininema mesophilum]